MHVASSDSFYCAEAVQRMYYYPPPHYYNGNWLYVSPWLWFDGDPHGGYDYTQWESKILGRMSQPAPVTITMAGYYNPGSRNGVVEATFRNDSTDTIAGRVILVITEDSLYYSVSNGDQWHNHVARDYLPTSSGQRVNIPAGDSVTVTQVFTIQSDWNPGKCDIITWIQNDSIQADSTKEIWQGGVIKVVALGIEEERVDQNQIQRINPVPNPFLEKTRFSFCLPAGVGYRITIYDVSGRHIRRLKGLSSGDRELVTWNRKDDAGSRVGSGVYLYTFESDIINTSGKLIVR